METLNKKVINYKDIPKEVLGNFTFNLMRGEFAQQCPAYLEVHLDEIDVDNEGEEDVIDEWLRKTYPGLEKESSFLIKFDPIALG